MNEKDGQMTSRGKEDRFQDRRHARAEESGRPTGWYQPGDAPHKPNGFASYCSDSAADRFLDANGIVLRRRVPIFFPHSEGYARSVIRCGITRP